MIKSLYPIFNKAWASTGGVYLISDTHFDNPDCKKMDPGWPSPMDYIAKLKKRVIKSDTLIHLGDVGNPEYMDYIKCYKVLIMGNHDQSIEKMKEHFDEVYSGPLFIGQKIVLSHEPLEASTCWVNIHGHVHNSNVDETNRINLAANVVNYEIYNLKEMIKTGLIKGIQDIHEKAIQNAVFKKTK